MKTIAIGVLLAIIASISITTTKAQFAQRPKYTGDANNDGFLDRTEVPKSLSNVFNSSELAWKAYENVTDTNGDGRVSLNEFIIFLSQEAANVYSGDANNDGFLDRSEIPESLSSGSIDRSWRELADTNDDGKVSLNEFIVYREEHDRDHALGVFKVVDTNHDNFIDKDEMSAWFKLSQDVQSNQKWNITTTINGKTKVMTSDGDTRLNLEEFRTYYDTVQGVDDAIDDAIQSVSDFFDSFTRPKYIGDGNNDGFFDKTEEPRPNYYDYDYNYNYDDSFTRPKYRGDGNNDGFLDSTEAPRRIFGDFLDSFFGR